jgi:hypothetical protein
MSHNLKSQIFKLLIEMDYNNVKTWMTELEPLKSSNLNFREEINFDNVKTVTVDIESENDMGIIIIYLDGHVFFDFMSKNDPMMKSHNWSENYIDFYDLKEKIEKALFLNWNKYQS